MNINHMRAVVIGALAVAVGCVPFFASAQTASVSELQSQLQALLGQVASLRAQLQQAEMASGTSGGAPSGTATGVGWGAGQGTPIMTGNGSSTASTTCPDFTRNLSLGVRGGDVSNLQEMLSEYPGIYPSGTVTDILVR